MARNRYEGELRCSKCDGMFPAKQADVLAVDQVFSPCCLAPIKPAGVLIYSWNKDGKPVRFRDEYVQNKILWD